MTQERPPLRDIQEPTVHRFHLKVTPGLMNRYAARGGNEATLTLNSKYQLPRTTVQAQPVLHPCQTPNSEATLRP